MDKILAIDDDAYTCESISLYLSELNYQVFSASNGEEGIKILEMEKPDLVVTDLKMPDIDGLEILKRAKSINPHIEVVLITAFDDMHSIIKAMQLGAYEYIAKPLDMEFFKYIVQKALESKTMSERMAINVHDDALDMQISNKLIGNSKSMKEIFKKIGKISVNKINVLLRGESGTGKELLAKIIHHSGITHNKPLVAVNCSAISESLLESELFGHEKGAFTGAIRDKKGKFELAGNGTIFLDEISELSFHLQSKLLRVLQEKEFERVGGETTIPMNARIIAATNGNLEKLVEKGQFREDLYYRLKVFTINIPPLRERKEDIPNLAIYFLKKMNREFHKNIRKITYEAMEILQNHEWQGNVRELENTLLQAFVLATGDVIEKEHITLNSEQKNEIEEDCELSLGEIEARYIKKVLLRYNWDMKKTCQILGVTKPTLYSKINKYSIKKKG